MLHNEGMARLRSIEGLISSMSHGMVQTPHGVDFSFSFLLHDVSAKLLSTLRKKLIVRAIHIQE